MTISQPNRLVFDLHEETCIEDGGQSIALEYHGTCEQVFIRVLSWAEGHDPEHSAIAPFQSDPDNVRVILEANYPPVEGDPAGLDDGQLDRARAHTVSALSEAVRAEAEIRDPRRDACEASISLAQAECSCLTAHLKAIDAELMKRAGA